MKSIVLFGAVAVIIAYMNCACHCAEIRNCAQQNSVTDDELAAIEAGTILESEHIHCHVKCVMDENDMYDDDSLSMHQKLWAHYRPQWTGCGKQLNKIMVDCVQGQRNEQNKCTKAYRTKVCVEQGMAEARAKETQDESH